MSAIERRPSSVPRGSEGTLIEAGAVHVEAAPAHMRDMRHEHVQTAITLRLAHRQWSDLQRRAARDATHDAIVYVLRMEPCVLHEKTQSTFNGDYAIMVNFRYTLLGP